jgi:organic radical activating enzyme
MAQDAAELVRPGYLFLELTNHCNMHCTFCPSDELEKPRKHVGEDDAIAFIRQAAELGLQRPIHFNVLGEPLLNKKVYEYISLCEELGLRVFLVTNISLLNEDRLERIFQHHNVVLVLSLQTPTAESYKLRQYTKISDIDEYLALVFNAVRAKFRYQSRSRIEIHVGSDLGAELMQSDGADALWQIFQGDSEQNKFLRSHIERLRALSVELRQDWPGFYEQEMQQSLVSYRREFDSGLMDLRPDRILTSAKVPLETEFWGWMFAPNAFLRIKRFGLWAKQDPFVAKHLAPNQIAYVEERTEPLHCEMAGNLTMLADGSYSLCCLDYEGKMQMGNIHTQSLESVLRSPERLETVENAMVHEVCRKCMGNLFVFDTSPLASGTQRIDKYGFGWHAYEPEMLGRGARWSKGQGNLYSPFSDSQEFSLEVSEQQPNGEFRHREQRSFRGRKGKVREVDVPLNLEPFRLYRAMVSSPVFSPKELYGSPDSRLLGLAVVDAALSGEPVPQDQRRTTTPLVQIAG